MPNPDAGRRGDGATDVVALRSLCRRKDRHAGLLFGDGDVSTGTRARRAGGSIPGAAATSVTDQPRRRVVWPTSIKWPSGSRVSSDLPTVILGFGEELRPFGRPLLLDPVDVRDTNIQERAGAVGVRQEIARLAARCFAPSNSLEGRHRSPTPLEASSERMRRCHVGR
jgi:hypothetical protein